MTVELPVLHSSAEASFAYYGPHDGWLIGLAVTRDSDALERSNWDVIVPPIVDAYPDDADTERMGHWAVGWIDYLVVRPGSQAAAEAQRWAEKMRGYPVADEEAWAQLEYEEEWCVRCDRAIRKDHPREGCREFRSEDDASEIEWKWRTRHG